MDRSTVLGQCRCCLKTGNHRVFTVPYNNNGVQKNFREIFLACFNLVLLPDEKLSEKLNLICTSCIEELNDALQFRSMVVESEQYLHNVTRSSENDFNAELELGLHSELDIKSENEELTVDSQHCTMECEDFVNDKAPLEKDDNTDKEMLLKSEPQMKPVESEVEAFISNQAPIAPPLEVFDKTDKDVLPTGVSNNNLDKSTSNDPSIFEQAPIAAPLAMEVVDQADNEMSPTSIPSERLKVTTPVDTVTLQQAPTAAPLTLFDRTAKEVSPTSIPNKKAKMTTSVDTVISKQGMGESRSLLPMECCITDSLLKVTAKVKKLSDDILAHCISKGRACPEMNIVQKNKKNERRFRVQTYENYPWMTGSCKLNKIYCFPCLLSANKSSTSAWDKTGYADLNNLYIAAHKHAQSEHHLQNILTMKMLAKTRVDEISSNVTVENNRMVNRNRDLMKRFIDTVILLAKQGLSIQEHNRKANSEIRDNYVETLSYLREYDAILDFHMSQCSTTENPEFSGLSSETQNDLIQCIASVLRDAIKLEISEAKFVSVMIEKTPVVGSGKEMTTVLRYVSKHGVEERFLGFSDVNDGCNENVVTEELLKILQQYECKEKLVGYSNAFNSDVSEATQTSMLKECPMAVPVPCHGHSLSLILTRFLENLQQHKLFFADIQSIVRFFDRFPNCAKLLKEIVNRRIPGEIFTWEYHSRVVKTIFNCRIHMLQTFKTMLESSDSPEWDSEALLLAEGLTKKLQDMQFCFLLHVFAEIFEQTDSLDGLLQSEEIDFENSMKKINSFKDWLTHFTYRFGFIHGSVQFLGSVTNFHTRTLYKQTFDGIIETVRQHIEYTYKAFTKMTFLDLLNTTHYLRFRSDFPHEKVSTLLKYYPDKFDMSVLKNELKALYKTEPLNKYDASELNLNVLAFGLKDAFPATLRLCDLSFTLPVTIKSADRLFSTIKRKRLNAYFDNTGNEGISNDYALIFIENDLLSRLKNNSNFYDNVLAYFVKKNRKILLG